MGASEGGDLKERIVKGGVDAFGNLRGTLGPEAVQRGLLVRRTGSFPSSVFGRLDKTFRHWNTKRLRELKKGQTVKKRNGNIGVGEIKRVRGAYENSHTPHQPQE